MIRDLLNMVVRRFLLPRTYLQEDHGTVGPVADDVPRGNNQDVLVFQGFLKAQRAAYASMKRQFPSAQIDLYQDSLDRLFENLKVLMYYQITPQRLDALLKFNKAWPEFNLFNERDIEGDTYHKIATNLDILVYRLGHLETCRMKKPVDANKQPIPWITYPALEYLSQFDFSDSSVFEFGSGNSTLFWARTARAVVSVENDPDWYQYLSQVTPGNVSLHYRDTLEGFTGLILENVKTFDVIIIDSIRYRFDAVNNAVKKLGDGGVIIFDNSDWYPNSCLALRNEGFDQFDFHGFGPVNGYTWTTSLFTKGRMKFKRKSADLRPIGGVIVNHDDDVTRKR